MSEKLLLILLSFSSDFTGGLSLTCLSGMGGSERSLQHQHIFLAVNLPPLTENSFQFSQLAFGLHMDLLQPSPLYYIEKDD